MPLRHLTLEPLPDAWESALYEAASRLVEATTQEYDVDEEGSHHLVRVCAPVEAWLRFMEAVKIEGAWRHSSRADR